MRILLILLVLFFSCNDEKDSTENNTTISDTKKNKDYDKKQPDEKSGTSCYWQIQQRDTLVAHLTENTNSITGKLTFDNYQKDGSTGAVKGIVEDNIYKLWYSFQSEGMNSVMEVWFKKEGNILIRGIGPSEMRGDSVYFSDKSAITFTGSRLEKTDCDNVPEKYK